MNKNLILKNLHTLVSHNVIGPKQCHSRYIGFKAELAFFEELRLENIKFIKGGVIISRSGNVSSLDDSIYYTIINDKTDFEDYRNLYLKLSGLNFINMFLLVFKDSWTIKPVMRFYAKTIELPVPEFEVFVFDKEKVKFDSAGSDIETILSCFCKKKIRSANIYPFDKEQEEWLINNLLKYNRESLLGLYIDRLIFDGYIGFSVVKGKPSDIDLILLNKSGQYKFIEIKEKDLPRHAKAGFGLDVPRINDFQRIELATGIDYFLIVRHIKDQVSRELIEWKFISIKDFIEDVKESVPVEGGFGMRSELSHNPTLICSLSKFSKLPRKS